MKERKHRIEDAVSATKAAVEEGIVGGGGSALVQAGAVLADGLGLSGDERTGVQVVAASLVTTAAGDRRQRRRGRRRHRRPRCASSRSVTASTRRPGEWGDLRAAGIVDPVKVTRSALENAASIAALVLTTEALVVEKPEAPAPAAGGNGHGHSHGPGGHHH